VRVGGEKVFRLAVKVGEVAASAAGDQNFISQAVACSSTATRRPRLPASMAHSRPPRRRENDGIEGMDHVRYMINTRKMFHSEAAISGNMAERYLAVSILRSM